MCSRYPAPVPSAILGVYQRVVYSSTTHNPPAKDLKGYVYNNLGATLTITGPPDGAAGIGARDTAGEERWSARLET